jgi:hypothetical protein
MKPIDLTELLAQMKVYGLIEYESPRPNRGPGVLITLPRTA